MQQAIVLVTQVEGLDTSQLEAEMEKRTLEAIAIQITGAEGPLAKLINGLYDRMEGKGWQSVWKQRNKECYLFRAATTQLARSASWWISDAECKDARKARGWARGLALRHDFF